MAGQEVRGNNGQVMKGFEYTEEFGFFSKWNGSGGKALSREVTQSGLCFLKDGSGSYVANRLQEGKGGPREAS